MGGGAAIRRPPSPALPAEGRENEKEGAEIEYWAFFAVHNATGLPPETADSSCPTADSLDRSTP